MARVLVSGCYDILHGGHIQFFREAKALGSHLTVCFASAEVLWQHKRRKSSIPDEHKRAVIAALDIVDEVIVTRGLDRGLDFKDDFLRLKPDILAVTEDDEYGALKRELCAQVGARYVVLPKTPPQFSPISTSEIVRWVKAPLAAPLRVDFAWGWLDVPRFARSGGYIVNCAISPTVSLRGWPYERNAGLGGSGAWMLLNGCDGVSAELSLGVGWQDPAVIQEGGLCVWLSGLRPELEIKTRGDLLRGRMALRWSGKEHSTPSMVDDARDYDAIFQAGRTARDAVWQNSMAGLAAAVQQSYAVQRAEGMEPLPGDPASPDPALAACRPMAWKYCGGGFGGYAVYLFGDSGGRDAACSLPGFRPIEPFLRD
jgi:cytidyltransferase-like protein